MARPTFSGLKSLMPSKDLYAALGLTRSASADEIKSAYRKLARKLHPDVNKAPDAQQKFTEVQSAYDVLSDPQKRKAYDQYGEAGVSGAAVSPRSGTGAGAGGTYRWPPGGQAGASSEFDPEELSSIFETFFSGQPGYGGPGARPGPTGASARGSRARNGSRARAPQTLEHQLDVDFITAAKGGKESLRVTEGSKGRTIEVRIPAGIADGAQLRVKAAGGSEGSDLLLTVRVAPHALFRRGGGGADAGKSLDLYLDLPLTIAEAALGAAVSVPTLEGSLEMKVPAGSTSGQKLRLRGKGITPETGEPGDLYVVVKIVAPDPAVLTEDDRAALRTMSEHLPSPRTGRGWATN